MKNIWMWLLKFLVATGFMIGMWIFSQSLAPKRNEVQKVYDDFVTQITAAAMLPSDSNALPSQPAVTIELTLKGDQSSDVIKHDINWADPVNVRKSLRILDLLQISNAFSESGSADAKNADIAFRVISPSGYKFEAFLQKSDLETNSALGLALVLMREIGQ